MTLDNQKELICSKTEPTDYYNIFLKREKVNYF